MAITPTQFAKKTTQCKYCISFSRETDQPADIARQKAANWGDAKRRVISSYREWMRAVRTWTMCFTMSNAESNKSEDSLFNNYKERFPRTAELTRCRQAPEMQTMYNLPIPISTLRTRIRQEFERHRYVAQLPVADVLLFKSHTEYQVRDRA